MLNKHQNPNSKKPILSSQFFWSVGLLFIALMVACQTTSNSNEGGTTSGQASNQELVKQIIDSGFVRVGFEPDAPPAYYMDEQGNPKGFDYELIKFISKNAFGSAKIKPVESSYDELPALLTSSQIQIMAGGRSVDETQGIIYSKPYLTYGFCIITTIRNKANLSTLNSLTGKRIGVYDETAGDWVKSKLKAKDVILLGDKEDENTPESDWMSDLVDGMVDAIVYDYPFATNEITDYKGNITISNKNINDPSEPNEYVLGIPVGQGELLKEINAAIDEYKKTAAYARMIQEYIPNPGSDVSSDQPGEDTYTVKEGETLSLIAQSHLGDITRYREIYLMNADRLASEDIIYVGQRLRKPSGWK